MPDTKWGLNCGVFANCNPVAVTFKRIESKCENFHVKYQLYLQENLSFNPLTLLFILPNRLPQWPEFGGLSAVSPHIRESKTILGCGFHAMNSRFHVLDS